MKEDLPTRVADFIRSRSGQEQLTSSADLEVEFGDSGNEAPRGFKDFLPELLAAQRDIRNITDDAGRPFYYSGLSMTDTYAGLLLLKIQGSLKMIAEVVRENSRIYPRPVPDALFRLAPFCLTEQQVQAGLHTMAKQGVYRDIAQVKTATGNTFIYSSDYLEPDHAAMLAEWIDRGQADNP